MGYFIGCPITEKMYELFVHLATDDDESDNFRSNVSTRAELVVFLGGDADQWLPQVVDLPSKEESRMFISRYVREIKTGTTYCDCIGHFVKSTRDEWFPSEVDD